MREVTGPLDYGAHVNDCLKRPFTMQPTATRERILEAAYDVFADRGYDGTSVRAVCARAEVNGASLNYHWKSKEALWLAVCERAITDLRNGLLAFLTQPMPFRELMPALISSLFDILQRDRRPARILTWISLQPQAVELPGVSEQLHHVMPVVMGYFKDLEARGEIAHVDVELVIVNLYAELLAPFVGDLGHRYYFGKGMDDPEHAERVKRALIDHTMRVLLPPEASG